MVLPEAIVHRLRTIDADRDPDVISDKDIKDGVGQQRAVRLQVNPTRMWQRAPQQTAERVEPFVPSKERLAASRMTLLGVPCCRS